MRYTFGQVLSHPYGSRTERLAGWWLELPGRKLRWWKWLLFNEGDGWLRWKAEHRDTFPPYGEPPDRYVVWPPIRRFLYALRYWGWAEWGWMKGEKPGQRDAY